MYDCPPLLLQLLVGSFAGSSSTSTHAYPGAPFLSRHATSPRGLIQLWLLVGTTLSSFLHSVFVQIEWLTRSLYLAVLVVSQTYILKPKSFSSTSATVPHAENGDWMRRMEEACLETLQPTTRRPHSCCTCRVIIECAKLYSVGRATWGSSSNHRYL